MVEKRRMFTSCMVFGIEYRMFLLSSLMEKLAMQSKISILKKDIQNPYFTEYIHNYDIDVFLFDKDEFIIKRTFLESYFLKIRQCRMRLKKIGTFKNYNQKADAVTWKDYLLGNEISYLIMKYFTSRQIQKEYLNIKIQNKFLQIGSTDILLSGYSSQESIAFGVNAKKLGLKVWCIVNSWKDVYINDFIPFEVDGLFVWSEKMKDEYLLLNKHLCAQKVYAYGNPVFDRFYQAKGVHSKKYYEDKYNLMPKREFLLYSMLDPDRYSKESELIKLISNEISKVFINEDRPYVIVRKNPFDKTDAVNNFFQNDKFIIVAEHFSHRNKEEDFFIQGREGENEWLDLLTYSVMNIGAASTVALEAIMFCKPVITIGFDERGEHSLLMESMAQAPFYKTLLEREDIVLSQSIKECIQYIQKFMYILDNRADIPEILGRFDGQASTRIAHKVLKGE